MKKAVVFLLCLCLSAVVLTAGAGANAEDCGIALFIDGEAFAPPAPMIVLNGTTYVPIRAFCSAMDENAVITWDDITKTVQVSGEGLAIEVTLGAQYMIANGRYLYIPDGCFTVDGSAMAPVRQLAKAYGAQVAWDCATNTACVTSGGTAIESGDLFYTRTIFSGFPELFSAKAEPRF